MNVPSSSTATTLQVHRTFAASREKVFRAWTDPEMLKKWMAPADDFAVPTVEVDLRVGGRYRIVMRGPDGKDNIAVGAYREIQPPERLVFTWTWEGSGMPDTLVTIELRAQGESTEVVLTHERFPTAETCEHHKQGWVACLTRLAKAL